MYQCRCDERLKANAEESTRLVYTGLREGLEHLKIDTKLIKTRGLSAATSVSFQFQWMTSEEGSVLIDFITAE
jgi:hypothetical protein